ncbi:MAG TPA: hypothetical protein VLG50_08155 [Candidatus Saccharimonadales bacterium]|nr:hypothetical protein [Candidatus Saccharimonadales bacterium]
MYVIILNHYTKANDTNLSSLKNLFHDSFYNIDILKLDEHVKVSDTLTIQECDEVILFKKALKLAKHQSNPTLIIKDNSICFKSCIKNDIITALQYEADCYFLCAWQESCYQYVHIDNTSMKWTNGSPAVQALLLQPHTINRFYKKIKHNQSISTCLLQMIKKYKYKCISFYPNLIEFDIRLATSNDDYLKLNRYLEDINSDSESDQTTVWIFLFAILIILLVILVPYFKRHRTL